MKYKVLRFCVGSDAQARSSEWRLWFQDPREDRCGRSDVYLGFRAIAKFQKVSFHEGGSIHYSFTSETHVRTSQPNQARHIDRWSMVEGLPLLALIVPASELWDRTVTVPSMIYVQAPPEGHATEIFIYLSQVPFPEPPHPFKTLWSEPLANGRFITLIWRINAITQENLEILIREKSRLNRLVQSSGTKGTDLRGFLFMRDGERRTFVDLSFGRES
jgi:hypothetical protein